MELLFIALGGAIIGLAAHYALPWRGEFGVLLLPAVGVAVAAIVWVALTALDWAWDGGWIWAVTLVAVAIVTGAAAFLLGRQRSTADARMLERLGG